MSKQDALLAAAISGLLLACSSSSSGDGTTGTVASGDTPIPSTQCPSGQIANPVVTNTIMGAMTEADFRTQCDAKHGIFETQPHCGGSNACRGMSYDDERQTLTEHSCKATNTCGGFSCVECD